MEKEAGIIVLGPSTVTFKLCEGLVKAGAYRCNKGLYVTLPPSRGSAVIP